MAANLDGIPKEIAEKMQTGDEKVAALAEQLRAVLWRAQCRDAARND